MNDPLLHSLREAVERAARAREAALRTDVAADVAAAPTEAANLDPDEAPFVNDIHLGLHRLSPALGHSYFQVLSDISDTARTSWAGTAHEIREVLATMLRLLAPDDEVKAKNWFRQEPNTSGPTQKQRVRFILESHGAGSKEGEVVGQVVVLEDMAGDLVRATYSRASDAAHRFKTRREVVRVLKYFDAFAHDLLNLE